MNSWFESWKKKNFIKKIIEKKNWVMKLEQLHRKQIRNNYVVQVKKY
jgi:hypothetical protein